MINSIKKWLDEGRHYWKGVVIYSNIPNHDRVFVLRFKKNRTDENEKILCELIKNYYQKIKAESILEMPNINEVKKEIQEDELYLSCKAQADSFYKDVMNKRAVLFSLSKKKSCTQEEMEQRRNLALDIVDGFKKVSELYDKADYVKTHKQLPCIKIKSKDKMPDFMVYFNLENARKNMNKLQKLSKTPERIQAISELSIKLEQLKKRWLSLRQSIQ